jgi:hypothetical protein
MRCMGSGFRLELRGICYLRQPRHIVVCATSVQHAVPQGFKRIRYDGVQATKTFAKVKALIQAALAKVEEVVKGAVKIIARLTYRQRYEQSTGRDPYRCPHCQRERELWCIWHPTYGVIYTEGEVIKRGTYTSSTQRAGP